MLGLVTLIVLDSVGAILLTVLFNESVTGDGVRELYSNNMFLIFRTVVGMISIAVGGYIVVKIVKSSLYLNAGIVGFLSLVLTILSYNGTLALWFNVVGFLFIFPAVFTGAFLRGVKSAT